MMGLNIALTGLVLFLFGLFMANIAKTPPRQQVLFSLSSSLTLIGLAAIPTGLIIDIWS
jgi:Na+/H+-dicarboxylate symporter